MRTYALGTPGTSFCTLSRFLLSSSKSVTIADQSLFLNLVRMSSHDWRSAATDLSRLERSATRRSSSDSESLEPARNLFVRMC